MAQRYQKVQECVFSANDVFPLGPPQSKSTLAQCLAEVNDREVVYGGWGNTKTDTGSCYSAAIAIWKYTPDAKCLAGEKSLTSIAVFKRIVNDVTKLNFLTPATFTTLQEFGTQWAWGINFILVTDGTNVSYTDPEFTSPETATSRFTQWKIVLEGDKFLLQSETQAFLATFKSIKANSTEDDLVLTHDRTNSNVIKWDLTSTGEFSTIINGQKRVLVATTPVSDTFPPVKVVLGRDTDAKNLVIYPAQSAPFDEDKKDIKVAGEIIPTTVFFAVAIIVIVVIILVIAGPAKSRR